MNQSKKNNISIFCDDQENVMKTVAVDELSFENFIILLQFIMDLSPIVSNIVGT